MCLELCSWANWRQILLLCHSWETPRAGHGEFSMLCKGNCQTLGQGTWPESPDSSLGNSAVICHEHSQQGEGRQQGQGLGDAALEAAMSQCKAGGWLRTERGREVTPRKDGGSWASTWFLQEMPQIITASEFSCIQLDWCKAKQGIPQRLGWVFLKTGGTLKSTLKLFST